MSASLSVFDDDPDAFVAAFNSSPDMLKLRGQAQTRRRGGLAKIAGKAAKSHFGMSLADLDRTAAPILPERSVIEAAHAALQVVAGYDPDHAAEANGRGFARSDVMLGHALASAALRDIAARPAYAALVMKLAARYRRQIGPKLSFRLGFSNQDDFFDA